MASFSSSIYTGQLGSAGSSLNAASGFPLKRDAQGNLECLRVEYALAGTEATGDTLNLGILPIGAKVIPSLSKIVCEDPGTALTVSVGDSTVAARYCNGAALTTAHDDFFTKLPSVTAVAAQYVPVEITDSLKTLVATLVLVTAPTAGAKITFYIVFVDKN